MASVISAAPLRAAEVETLLLPGVDVRRIDFAVGAWCRYRVIDEAMGEADTSDVRLAIVGKESDGKGTAYWLEIESGPSAGPEGERDFTRVLVDERVRSMAPGDSLHHFVRRYYIRKGKGPVEPGDPRDLRRITVVSPASEADWRVSPDVRLATAVGEVACELREFRSEQSRDVPAGRVTIRQHRVDRVRVWVSPAIPIFHLARCEIERERESRAIPPLRGIPDSGPRRSRTTSEIVSHGTGARAKISTP